jgi:ubiquinone/menaquinone biosynthesis C-methylase UbiE
MLRHALRLRAAAPAGRFSRHSGTVASPATDNAPVLGWMGRPETDANRPLEEDEFFPARTPADVDREHFREAPSVRFWNAWRHDDSKSPAASVADILAQISAATKSPADAAYWAYHVFRSSWFLGQGAAGMLVSSVAGAGPDAAPSLSRARAGAAAAERLVSEAVQVYKQDLKRVNDGTHRAPYDMDPRHRQFNPAFVADKSLRFASEARSTLRKHAAATKQRASPESGREATEAADAVPGTRVWLSSPLYPDYYLNTFHWQTDGWLSKESAKVYEVSTETLFVGRQDAMQRTALAPLREWFDETQQSATGENVKLLEMACGTGRFLTFTRDTYPQIDAVGLDLSPFYLAEARENAQYWERFTAGVTSSRFVKNAGNEKTQKRVASLATEALRQVGSLAKAAGVPTPPLPAALREAVETFSAAEDEKARYVPSLGRCEFVQAAAESMPFPDESFDAVTCVYLFHELPPAVRREAAREAARVLKPGGVFILADSIQLGDRPRVDAHLGRFGDFNEPYYRSWLREDTVELFGERGAGLEPWTKELCSSTKVLSFRKPLK